MLTPDRREILRYLGMRGAQPDEALEAEIGRCARDIAEAAQFRQVARVFPARVDADGALVDGVRFESRDLARALRGCAQVCMMAATLGPGPDRLVARATAAGRVSRAVVLQAAGAALIEAWCDQVQREASEPLRAQGFHARPRFSPGYGDLSLDCQPTFFRMLDVQKRIGVALTNSFLMTPTKSVTALFGLWAGAPEGETSGCAQCSARDACAFRNEQSVAPPSGETLWEEP